MTDGGKERDGRETTLYERFTSWLVKAVSSFVQDVRHKVVEEGFWARVVTPRAQSISVHASGRPGGDPLGRWFDEERAKLAASPSLDRDRLANEPKGPDRGIDL